ncbi:MAG TPA: circadian clock protein KaiC [Blastocatellia bacterium]|jgi:circadian clock protein KaiC|nr:circadian clock protein KaiC [Blastocatellia bacterium]
MAQKKKASRPSSKTLPKAPTGIQGLDEITGGGLPRGRPTLVSGGAGSGKTLFGLEFLVRGATQYGEPGVFVSFEESIPDLTRNVASLGFDLDRLVADKKLFVDHVSIMRSELGETGEYDLEGLFIRIADAVQRVGAQRVVLDTIETLFGNLPNPVILRAEIHRLFNWLKQKGLTTVITAERDRPDKLTRHSIEEFVSDCVIVLDHRIREEISTRRLRVVKYRGSTHGTNEYPFLIDEQGISVLPISSLSLDHAASAARVSTGIDRLDGMMGGKGFYQGSSILLSGTSGTGKTSVAAHFVDAACRRGERCLYFAFEESPRQVVRNMRSIGIDLDQWVRKGPLQFHAARPTYGGIEEVLLVTHKHISSFQPSIVVVDPITNLLMVSTQNEVRSMLTRLVDFLKTQGITAIFTSLTAAGELEASEADVSSLMDTWLLLKNIEVGGERNRALYVLKSRGMEHSNQIREFVLTDDGLRLLDVYLGPEGVLTGSARVSQEMREKAVVTFRRQEQETHRRELERKRRIFEARMVMLRAEFEAEEEILQQTISESELLGEEVVQDRVQMVLSRKADSSAYKRDGRAKGGRRR